MSSDFRLAYPNDATNDELFSCLQQVVSLLKGDKKFAAPIALTGHNTPGEAVVAVQNSAPGSPTAIFYDKNGVAILQINSDGNVTGPGGSNIATTDGTQTLKNKTMLVSDGNTFGGITNAMLDPSAQGSSLRVHQTASQATANGDTTLTFNGIDWQPSGATVWAVGSPTHIVIPSAGVWFIWFSVTNDDGWEPLGWYVGWITKTKSGVATDTPDLTRNGVYNSTDAQTQRKGGSFFFVESFSANDYFECKINVNKATGGNNMRTEANSVFAGAFRVSS